jgi:ribosomal protein L2
MPTKKLYYCGKLQAVIGKIAGSGRKDKPFVKAWNKRRARNAKGEKHMLFQGLQ